MVLTNAQRQSRFRARAAYMQNLRPADILVRACVTSGIARAFFLSVGGRSARVTSALFPSDSGRRPASIAVVGLLR
jgi:hypothetical protein